MRLRVVATIALLSLAPCLAEIRRDTPVGLVLLTGAGSIIPAQSETPLSAKVGDILFQGDRFKSGSSAATFLFCPSNSSQTLAPASEVLFQASQVNVRTGKITGQTKIQTCFLPTVVHLATASEQHYGASIVRGLNPQPQAPPISNDKLDSAVRAEIGPMEQALKANPADSAALVARAAIFEKYKLTANALADYRSASNNWADAVWIKGKIFELQETLSTAAATAASANLAVGQTFAILIGISNYQKLPKELWLHFADADAKSFAQYLASPRGGSVPPENMVMLTNERATTAAIRNAFNTFLKGRAGKNDTVYIVLAAHGTVENPGNKGAYIVTYDSDPQDLATTAFPMVEIQDLMQTELTKIGRLALFVDVCHAGNIGAIQNTSVNAAVERLGEAEGDLLGFMASRPKELSREGAQFGGGHGVFSYFLLKSFGDDADRNKDGIVTVNEVIDFVRDQVENATGNAQHPRDFGNVDTASPFADVKKSGIPITRLPKLLDVSGSPVLLADAGQAPTTALGSVSETARLFDEAIRQRNLLPGSPGSAFDLLRQLSTQLTAEQVLPKTNALRIALEDSGQQVVLRYLQGDQIPQLQQDFNRGASYFDAASQLTPESLYLDSRTVFCKGRSLIFDKRYGNAADLLERAVRIDPGAAYAYNALGIAYLEQADFTRALPAFRDALRRAPQWTYPYHNLALASIESGDYASAIRSYQQAIRLAPEYSYLHYNLGLTYERINRRRDAEVELRKAIDLSPDLGDGYNALGSLRATAGKPKQAEDLYNQALQRDPNLLAARQNLALLLSGRPNRQNEAISLWRDNLTRSPEYLPSRISLADYLAKQGNDAQAIGEYREILKLKPAYLAAEVSLAELLVKTKSNDEALAVIQQARLQDPSNAEILETLGDVQAARQNIAEARAAYQQATPLAADRAVAKRLRAKVASSGGSR